MAVSMAVCPARQEQAETNKQKRVFRFETFKIEIFFATRFAMGGGAPLEYLNKKTWHPGRLQNRERVWLAEESAAAEQRKVDELRAEREEERAREELEALAQGAGVRKREEKLDWMYQGGVGAAKKVEEELLQQEKDDEARQAREEREKSGGREHGHHRWLTQDGNKNNNNEIWQRLHGDPLMMMKQQEMQARRSIVSNPIKMDAVRRRVEDEKRRKDEKKRSKRDRKEKKEGKEKKKERKEGREHKRGRRPDDRRGDRHDNGDKTQARPTEHQPSYGLSHSASAPEHLKSRTNTTAIEETKKRLEDAARRHEEETRVEEQRHATRRSHHTKTTRHKAKTSDLSEEEKKRRLEEMVHNSTHVDTVRRSRVETHAKTAQAEEHALLHEHQNQNRPR